MPGKTVPPPQGKQTGNDHSGIGGMGNYRQDGTAAGTGGKLLKAVTDSVVETFE